MYNNDRCTPEWVKFVRPSNIWTATRSFSTSASTVTFILHILLVYDLFTLLLFHFYDLSFMQSVCNQCFFSISSISCISLGFFGRLNEMHLLKWCHLWILLNYCTWSLLCHSNWFAISQKKYQYFKLLSV